MHIFVLLNLFLQVFIYVDSEEFLEFSHFPDSNTDENIYLTDRDTDVVLDAISKSSRYVYFLGTSGLTVHNVNFRCQSNSRSVALSTITFCCRSDTLQNRECHNLMLNTKEKRISCGRFEMRYTTNKNTGASFTVSSRPDVAYNGIISCSLSDSEAVIESNEIELRDARYYSNQLNITPTNQIQNYTQPISPLSFPLSFSCGDYHSTISNWPTWMAAVWDRISPYEWAYCLVNGTNTPVSCASSKNTINIGDGITVMDGNLYLLSPRLLYANPDSALICRTKNNKSPLNTIAYSSRNIDSPTLLKGLFIDESSSPTNADKLIALSDRLTKLVFADGTHLNNFYLQAFYRRPVNVNSTFSWYKDGGLLSGDAAQQYSFLLPSRIERNLEGIYQLKVSSPPSQELFFTFKISIVGPPRFVSVGCMHDLFYIMEGDFQSLTCTLGVGKSEIYVGVNGLESNTPDRLKHSLNTSLDISNQWLNNLDIDFSTSDHDRNGKSVSLTVKNLKVEQNFRLVIKASNEYGQSQMAGSVRVVPKPVLKSLPSASSCSVNCDFKNFEVQCAVETPIIDKWKNVLAINLLQEWVIDRTWTYESLKLISDLKGFFNSYQPTIIEISQFTQLVDETKSNISLQNVLTSKTGQQRSEIVIECRIRLYVNNSRAQFKKVEFPDDHSGRKRRSIFPESNLIYDSFLEADAELAEKFRAVHVFSSVEEPSAFASLSWILAIVISCIIVLLVIVLSIWLCKRDRGESYNAYHKELKIGNDPLSELKVNCSFQPFERPEEPPIAASRYSFSEKSVKYGSDDEGELDDYNIDPGNFNEDASYIGQYGSITRVPGTSYKGSATRLSTHHTAV